MEMVEQNSSDLQSASASRDQASHDVGGFFNHSASECNMQEHMDRLGPGDILPPLGRSTEMLDLSRDIDVSFFDRSLTILLF